MGKKIQNKLDNRPRKILGYNTPKEIMNLEFKKRSLASLINDNSLLR